VFVWVAAARTPGSQGGQNAGISAGEYFLAQGISIWRYLQLIVFPFGVPWGFNVDTAIPVPPVWAGCCLWLLLALAVFAATQRFRNAGAGFWFIGGVVLLLPSSSIFPAADLSADRRMYLPMIAFAACAGLLLERLRPLAVTAIVSVLIVLSIQRTYVWKTEQSLWSDAAAKSPGKLRPKLQLARYSDPRRGLELLKQAGALAPNDPRVPSEAGRIYLVELGDPADALAQFGRALALDPRSASAFNNRGAALLALGQRDAARQDFERALKLDPSLAEARENLARSGGH